MRKSSIFTLVTCGNILLAGLIVLHARHSQSAAANGLAERAGMVRSLGLTDLCLFTEARYTRHPAMADRFAPFQDHPGAMEHFPSGSLVTPPNKRLHEHTP
jgi:hypothetical protein